MSDNFLSPYKIIKRFRFLPLAVKSVRNWPLFMYNYALGKTDGIYRFRNGAQLKIFSGFDHVPIIEVMMKKDYGKIPDNSVLIDIGASTGVFSIYSFFTAKNIKIYAFEPSSQYFSMLKENIKINELNTSIKCFNKAVAGKNERRTIVLRSEKFSYPSLISSPLADSAQQEIDCITLESIFNENKIAGINILKMDCEGAEYEILENAPSHIMDKIEEIRMEYHNLSAEKSVESLRRILEKKGFAQTYFKPTNEIFGNIWFRKKSDLNPKSTVLSG